jgi:hypothetical protein
VNEGLYDPLPDGSTYYPPFDVSGVNAVTIKDANTTITDFNIFGWDQMTFARVNYGAAPNQTVEINIDAKLNSDDVDTIINELHSNLDNHTPVEGGATYSFNFHSNSRTSASDTAVNGLLDAGWFMTLNNTVLLGQPIQIGPSILDDDFDPDSFGYSVSMNDAGDRIIVGSPYDDDILGTNAGQAKVYHYIDGVGWRILGQIIYSSEGDQIGFSVSMNAAGDRVAIGAPFNDGLDAQGNNNGRAQIYEYNDVTQQWVQLGSDIYGEAEYDQSGFSVSINAAGDRVAIGAPYNDGNNGLGSAFGHTRIYEYDEINSSWIQLGQDIDGEAEGDRSGYSVSMNAAGDRVAIGAYFNDGTSINSGHTRIYEYDVSTQGWTQLGSDIDGEAAYDLSGNSVSMNSTGDRVAIGAVFSNANGVDSGHTRIYEYNVNTQDWTQLGQDINGETSLDRSGYSVSMNSTGDRVAIGSIGSIGGTINTSYSGAARIFQYSNGTWIQITEDIDGGSLDYLGYSVSMNAQGDRVAIGAPEADPNNPGPGYVQVYQI